jgi:hypothetical protein
MLCAGSLKASLCGVAVLGMMLAAPSHAEVEGRGETVMASSELEAFENRAVQILYHHEGQIDEPSLGRKLSQFGGNMVDTELSKALAAGKQAVDGAQSHPFRVKFTLEDLSGDQANYKYVSDNLLPALESFMKRHMRVRPFQFNPLSTWLFSSLRSSTMLAQSAGRWHPDPDLAILHRALHLYLLVCLV